MEGSVTVSRTRVRREATWTRMALRELDKALAANDEDSARAIMNEIAGVWGTLANEDED